MPDVFKCFCNKTRVAKIPPRYCNELCGAALGAKKREDAITHNNNGKKIQYKINRRPSQRKNNTVRSKGQIKRREREKSSVRAKVEHVFGIVKGLFCYSPFIFYRLLLYKQDCPIADPIIRVFV